MKLIPLEIWKEKVSSEGYRPSKVATYEETGYIDCMKRGADGVVHHNKVDLVKVNGEWYAQVD